MGGQLSSGFQDALAAPQVVTGISIKISTQPRHAAVELRGQPHQDPGAWAEGAAWWSNDPMGLPQGREETEGIHVGGQGRRGSLLS